MKTFNITGRCIPKEHYMVAVDDKIKTMRAMVARGDYFVMNRARQYGKTTTLRLLADDLKDEYIVILLDFQMMSRSQFCDEPSFCRAFLKMLLRTAKNQQIEGLDATLLHPLEKSMDGIAELGELFSCLSEMCGKAPIPLVLMIDEIDSASDYPVFLDFLSQLRAYYLCRDTTPTFRSVILAGVRDIRNLQSRIRPEEEHTRNSPWNIAVPFDVDMSLPREGIKEMLEEYAAEHAVMFSAEAVAAEIYDYTSGYPFLVSLLCRTIDAGALPWTPESVRDAVKTILREKVTLFESLARQIEERAELRQMLHSILFEGEKLSYNVYGGACEIGVMFGFIRNDNGTVAITNRIFETWMYNYFLAKEQLTSISYKAASRDKNQFIRGGMLDMDYVMERFVQHFGDVYGENDKRFVEEYGRKIFLLYLQPIINGTGNYYIESRTRDAKRTDVIVDYLGKRFIIEMKIWNGEKYHQEGEDQLEGYLERYHLEKGYLLTFSFNKRKEPRIEEKLHKGKTLLEVFV